MGFNAESGKSWLISAYAFPQTELWKSGPGGAVPLHQRQVTLDNGMLALVCSCPTDVGVRYHPE
jgi:hypothetical protein